MFADKLNLASTSVLSEEGVRIVKCSRFVMWLERVAFFCVRSTFLLTLSTMFHLRSDIATLIAGSCAIFAHLIVISGSFLSNRVSPKTMIIVCCMCLPLIYIFYYTGVLGRSLYFVAVLFALLFGFGTISLYNSTLSLSREYSLSQISYASVFSGSRMVINLIAVFIFFIMPVAYLASGPHVPPSVSMVVIIFVLFRCIADIRLLFIRGKEDDLRLSLDSSNEKKLGFCFKDVEWKKMIFFSAILGPFFAIISEAQTAWYFQGMILHREGWGSLIINPAQMLAVVPFISILIAPILSFTSKKMIKRRVIWQMVIGLFMVTFASILAAFVQQYSTVFALKPVHIIFQIGQYAALAIGEAFLTIAVVGTIMHSSTKKHLAIGLCCISIASIFGTLISVALCMLFSGSTTWWIEVSSGLCILSFFPVIWFVRGILLFVDGSNITSA